MSFERRIRLILPWHILSFINLSFEPLHVPYLTFRMWWSAGSIVLLFIGRLAVHVLTLSPTHKSKKSWDQHNELIWRFVHNTHTYSDRNNRKLESSVTFISMAKCIRINFNIIGEYLAKLNYMSACVVISIKMWNASKIGSN